MKKIEVECIPLDNKGERYMLWVKTMDQVIEIETDKENLRHIIEIIDNQII